jgi:hypothetical protein
MLVAVTLYLMHLVIIMKGLIKGPHSRRRVARPLGKIIKNVGHELQALIVAKKEIGNSNIDVNE